MKTIYISILGSFLLLSGLAHLIAPEMTERWMTDIRIVRTIGALLLMLAVPCLIWRGWYFLTLFLGLVVSGIWRLCFPQNSVEMQQKSYPRRVHGALLLGAAILVWVMYP